MKHHTGGLLVLIPGTPGLLLIAALSILLLLFLIIKARMQPFLAMLVVSLITALGAGVGVEELLGTVQNSNVTGLVQSGIGGILGDVAIILGLGTMLGSILEVSGGAERFATRLLDAFGERRAPLAMGLTGLIFGIPVFLDVGIFVLAPLVYAATKRSGKSILLYCLPLLGGLSITHAFLPPHPGPVAAAGLLHVDLGWLILFGLVCGIPAWAAGLVYSKWIGERIFVPVPEDMMQAAEESKATLEAEVAERGGSIEEPPSLRAMLTIIATPMVLILLSTFSSIILDPSSLRSVLEFLGHPFVALTLTLFLAYYLLGLRRGWSRQSLERVSTASLKPVGSILLVVGAGGVFGAVLEATGVAQAVADAFADFGMPLIVLAFLISAVIRIAQGSATVAIVTTAGILKPMLESGDFSQPMLALIIVAVSSGSIIASHVNDGGFWMVGQYFGIPERINLKSWTVLETVLSLVGFAMAAVVSIFV